MKCLLSCYSKDRRGEITQLKVYDYPPLSSTVPNASIAINTSDLDSKIAGMVDGVVTASINNKLGAMRNNFFDMIDQRRAA